MGQVVVGIVATTMLETRTIGPTTEVFVSMARKFLRLLVTGSLVKIRNWSDSQNQ